VRLKFQQVLFLLRGFTVGLPGSRVVPGLGSSGFEQAA